MSHQKRTDEEVIDSLIEEVAQGQIKRDHLVNDAYNFSDQAQALYFSNARKFLESDVSSIVMNSFPDLSDIELLRAFGSDGI